jgi:anti-anti-sigma regulatory factor
VRISTRGNLLVASVAASVEVVRFLRSDLRPHLDDVGHAALSPLLWEIEEAALPALAEGDTLVVNLGLIGPFSAAFYRCLLELRHRVQARGGRLVLCGLSPLLREVFELFRGPRVFTIVGTEAEACRVAGPGRRTRAAN